MAFHCPMVGEPILKMRALSLLFAALACSLAGEDEGLNVEVFEHAHNRAAVEARLEFCL